ncbi:MAG: HAMP domain-containing histidine kinase [Gemmatimonadetes bacterium]|nr:HAMP domain-containing histidine kinase [Gemmatimonadota bacterium]
MAVREWLRPPRHLLVLFVGLTLVLAAALGWLGWRLLQQDRALETQRLRDHLETAATAVAAALERRLAETERTLGRLASLPARELRAQGAAWARDLSDGAVLLVRSGEGLEAFPARRLAYYPVLPPSRSPPAETFADGEALEFRFQDFAGAANAYRVHTRSRDGLVRAGALLRLGRALRKAGREEPALDAYAQLAGFDSLPLDGVPAGLLGRHARISILEALGRVAESRQTADSLYRDLLSARWPLSRGAFEFYVTDLLPRLAAATRDAPSAKAALARGVALLWADWSAGNAPSGGGRRLLRDEEISAVVLWADGREERVALLATADHLRAVWLRELEPLLQREGVRIALDDLEGNPVISQLGDDATPRVVRTAAETHLPWTLRLASADPGNLTAEFAVRRRLMLAGFGVAVLLALVAAYAVARAVTRELGVARLQSEFVAAVSHEFRTPLTSMRQLTELLASGRVPTEERRGQYYEVLRREGERLHRLVEGLLDFGRMEAGAHEFRLQSLDVAALVRETVDDFRAEVSERGWVVDLEATQDAGAVRADREALSRALWNLLDNAVKYSPEHRTVWVKVGGADGRVAISVRDQGAGIPASERDAIFEKFVRGSSAGVAGVKGTGIGLAMVQHIVRAHGGEIRVESQPGAGSTFTILLAVER